jgi:hypothetical protein
VLAIQYTGPAAPRVQEGDTLRLTAVALDINGNPLPDVPIIWRVLAVPLDSVGLTLDSLTGLVTGVAAGGPWPVQGRADNLRTSQIQITVLPAPDSVAFVDSTRVTVDTGVVVSPPLGVIVYDLTTTPGDTVGLGGTRVVFRLTEPVPGSPEAATVALAPNGGTPGADSSLVELTTSSAGLADATAQRVGAVQPDSIIVEAFAFTAHGDTVAGSPVRFVVLFARN